MSLKSKKASNTIDFLDHSLNDPMCQRIIKQMNSIKVSQIGCEGAGDPYHFQSKLNRVTIEGNDDYRLVLFFIKKGTQMPLHDHPNMSVFFKLMFGKLSYHSYDKVDKKFQYNQFSNDEYTEILESHTQVEAKKSSKKVLDSNNLLVVRPSCGNMHQFLAEEDSCFFDICLPNYTTDSLRRITYFNEIADDVVCDNSGRDCITKIEYHTTPPVLPVGFDITELQYRGEMLDL
jgi:hypothetical protein